MNRVGDKLGVTQRGDRNADEARLQTRLGTNRFFSLGGVPDVFHVAFDLGLKTLCEQCSNTIKNFEALSDKLNSMQLDECAAAKEMVGVVMDDNGFHSTEVMREKLGITYLVG